MQSSRSWGLRGRDPAGSSEDLTKEEVIFTICYAQSARNHPAVRMTLTPCPSSLSYSPGARQQIESWRSLIRLLREFHNAGISLKGVREFRVGDMRRGREKEEDLTESNAAF